MKKINFKKNKIKNDKSKKSKRIRKPLNFFGIFIPIASLIPVASVLTPAIFSSLQKMHLKTNANEKQKYISIGEAAIFQFEIMDLSTDWEFLHWTWDYTLSSRKTLTFEQTEIEYKDPNFVLLNITPKKIDESILEIGDEISFNIFFTYYDESTNTSWSQTFSNNYIKIWYA